MMNRLFVPLVALVAPLVLGSCSKLLDEQPDERVLLTSADKVRRILVNAYPLTSYAYACEMSTDNVDDYGTDNPNFTKFTYDLVYWNDGPEYNASDGMRALWRAHYLSIQHANTALKAIQDLGGGSELDAAKGEALLIRAYSHFVLVNLFGKHYNSASSSKDLGVPYMTAPEVTLNPQYKRNSVAEVYAAIDKDLTEGLPLISDSFYSEKAYHFNKAAAEAFAARFYLYYEQWNKAIEHATKALDGKAPRRWADFQEASIVGAKTEDAYAKLYSRETISANFLLLPVTSGAVSYFSYAQMKRFSMTHRVAEEVFLGENIWRTSTTAQADYWQVPFVSSSYNYRDVINQSKYPYYASNKDKTLTVPFTAEETLLVKAEAEIIQKKYDAAVADLNTWTSAYLNTTKKSFTKEDIIAFYKALEYNSEATPTMKKKLHPAFTLDGGEDQEMLLHHLLQCRRVATAHEGLRWFDIRRYGIEVYRFVHDTKDRAKVTVAKTLSSWDEHTTFQIPQNVRNAGLEPTPRTN
nr:RagB/SusD family nutrient uptake outer membrane protein [uncultured Porphyromonas sp.]